MPELPTMLTFKHGYTNPNSEESDSKGTFIVPETQTTALLEPPMVMATTITPVQEIMPFRQGSLPRTRKPPVKIIRVQF